MQPPQVIDQAMAAQLPARLAEPFSRVRVGVGVGDASGGYPFESGDSLVPVASLGRRDSLAVPEGTVSAEECFLQPFLNQRITRKAVLQGGEAVNRLIEPPSQQRGQAVHVRRIVGRCRSRQRAMGLRHVRLFLVNRAASMRLACRGTSLGAGTVRVTACLRSPAWPRPQHRMVFEVITVAALAFAACGRGWNRPGRVGWIGLIIRIHAAPLAVSDVV